ncbi:MAG: hypothetical protein KKD30_16620 [Gammaproteobacteria bacterium]|nr:hypothetical protein [Gammaproteobacteria bacterium]MBU0883988.1 hypothetical protein [Gammaproteobacteria bacterium]MBU1861568.1 hypothetical protein [Gammaproteobacteria bacterium]
MSPKSRTLFHFTRSLEFLKSILSNGFRPRYCLEDTRYIGVDYMALPMCCFCDIPISRIKEHTGFYGEYGLGMTKEWGAINNLEPILYASSTGTVANFINHVIEFNDKEMHPDGKKFYDEITDHFDRILGLTKPLSGLMLIGGNLSRKTSIKKMSGASSQAATNF